MKTCLKIFIAIFLLSVVFITYDFSVQKAEAWTECSGWDCEYRCSGIAFYWYCQQQCFVYQMVHDGWSCFWFQQCTWSYINENWQFIQNCSTVYGDWGPNYCKDNDVYHSRLAAIGSCTGSGCSWGNWTLQEVKVADCASDSCGDYGDWYCTDCGAILEYADD